MSNTIYELTKYDYMYDDTFYYQFKKDDAVAWRVKGFLREYLRNDTGYYDDVRRSIKILHLLKGVDTIDGIALVLETEGAAYTLKEKELL